jgi:hypothetical protein
MKNDLNPWADAMLAQLWICQLANHIALKTCDPQNWMTDAYLLPREPRLNPLEFHGRRRSISLPQGAEANGRRQSNPAPMAGSLDQVTRRAD